MQEPARCPVCGSIDVAPDGRCPWCSYQNKEDIKNVGSKTHR